MDSVVRSAVAEIPSPREADNTMPRFWKRRYKHKDDVELYVFINDPRTMWRTWENGLFGLRVFYYNYNYVDASFLLRENEDYPGGLSAYGYLGSI